MKKNVWDDEPANSCMKRRHTIEAYIKNGRMGERISLTTVVSNTNVSYKTSHRVQNLLYTFSWINVQGGRFMALA